MGRGSHRRARRDRPHRPGRPDARGGDGDGLPGRWPDVRLFLCQPQRGGGVRVWGKLHQCGGWGGRRGWGWGWGRRRSGRERESVEAKHILERAWFTTSRLPPIPFSSAGECAPFRCRRGEPLFPPCPPEGHARPCAHPPPVEQSAPARAPPAPRRRAEREKHKNAATSRAPSHGPAPGPGPAPRPRRGLHG